MLVRDFSAASVKQVMVGDETSGGRTMNAILMIQREITQFLPIHKNFRAAWGVEFLTKKPRRHCTNRIS